MQKIGKTVNKLYISTSQFCNTAAICQLPSCGGHAYFLLNGNVYILIRKEASFNFIISIFRMRDNYEVSTSRNIHLTQNYTSSEMFCQFYIDRSMSPCDLERSYQEQTVAVLSNNQDPPFSEKSITIYYLLFELCNSSMRTPQSCPLHDGSWERVVIM